MFALRVSCRRLWSFVVVCRRLSSFVLRRVAVIPCLWEKLQHGFIFGCFTRDVASFRVAGVALCDMWTCLVTCRKSFCVAGAILSRHFQNMSCIFRGGRSTLVVSIFIFRGRGSTSDVSCCVLSANHIGRAARSGDRVQIVWQTWQFL